MCGTCVTDDPACNRLDRNTSFLTQSECEAWCIAWSGNDSLDCNSDKFHCCGWEYGTDFNAGRSIDCKIF
jgi:hypothetical protein